MPTSHPDPTACCAACPGCPECSLEHEDSAPVDHDRDIVADPRDDRREAA
jgi:hypothetical protein